MSGRMKVEGKLLSIGDWAREICTVECCKLVTTR